MVCTFKNLIFKSTLASYEGEVVTRIFLIELRPSRKTERHWFATSRTCFKETCLKAHPISFRGGAHELYNGKSIAHLHLYAYEEASRHHHTLCQHVGCDKPLALESVHKNHFYSFLIQILSTHSSRF